MKQSKIKLIGTAAIYLILMLGIAWFSAMKNEESIKDKSKIAFLTAIKQEKELFIPQVIINFNPSSTNRIPVEEKIDWSAQFYLAMEDSCRHRFDSIFREEMKKQGLNLNTSICYTHNGKTISTMKKNADGGIKIIHEKTYRKNNKKENDITLRAYVYLPLYVLVGQPALYTMILFTLLAVAMYIYTRNREKKQITTTSSPHEAATRTTDNARWIIISKEVWWDEKNHIIKKGETSMILTGESLKFFKLFLENKSFFLSFKTIYESYGLKDEAPEFKDRIYQSIKLLRKDLIGFGITIRSVRGRGYELIFQ